MPCQIASNSGATGADMQMLGTPPIDIRQGALNCRPNHHCHPKSVRNPRQVLDSAIRRLDHLEQRLRLADQAMVCCVDRPQAVLEDLRWVREVRYLRIRHRNLRRFQCHRWDGWLKKKNGKTVRMRYIGQLSYMA